MEFKHTYHLQKITELTFTFATIQAKSIDIVNVGTKPMYQVGLFKEFHPMSLSNQKNMCNRSYSLREKKTYMIMSTQNTIIFISVHLQFLNTSRLTQLLYVMRQ